MSRKSVSREGLGIQTILRLSDAEFEKWMDSVEEAGLRVSTGRAKKTRR